MDTVDYKFQSNSWRDSSENASINQILLFQDTFYMWKRLLGLFYKKVLNTFTIHLVLLVKSVSRNSQAQVDKVSKLLSL